MVYLFAAYSVVWVALFAYVFLLRSQLEAMRGELEELKSRSRDRGSPRG